MNSCFHFVNSNNILNSPSDFVKYNCACFIPSAIQINNVYNTKQFVSYDATVDPERRVLLQQTVFVCNRIDSSVGRTILGCTAYIGA